MSKKYFIPNADAEFDEWLQKFAKALKDIANEIGINQQEVQRVITLKDAWVVAFQNHLAMRDSARAGLWRLIQTFTKTIFTDTGLTSGRRYHYKVRAGNAAGISEFSAIADCIAP